jgi:hypothetical protein
MLHTLRPGVLASFALATLLASRHPAQAGRGAKWAKVPFRAYPAWLGKCSGEGQRRHSAGGRESLQVKQSGVAGTSLLSSDMEWHRGDLPIIISTS